MIKLTRLLAASTLLAACALASGPAAAQARGKYDPGASDTEIKVGHTGPWSGPVSALAEIFKTMNAYLARVNEAGGVNGRKVTFISLDDAYTPPKTLEHTRRLVEQDEVLFMYLQVGAAQAGATQRYLNSKGVPQMFVMSGGSRFNDPASSPWTSAAYPSHAGEGAIFGRYVAGKMKNAKVGILSQNDDFGKDYVRGFKGAVAGSPGIQVVKEAVYEAGDPTIDSQLATLAASGADVFLNVTSGRAAAQSLNVANSPWKPLHIMDGPWADIDTIFKPAGLEKAKGIVSVGYLKSVSDPAWAKDPAILDYLAFMNKYRAGADVASLRNLHGYLYAQVLVHILQQAGNDLTRENVNKVALNLRDVSFGLLLPAVKISTSTTQRHLIPTQQLRQFDGEKFVPIE